MLMAKELWTAGLLLGVAAARPFDSKLLFRFPRHKSIDPAHLEIVALNVAVRMDM
jgi:hypothetical protein